MAKTQLKVAKPVYSGLSILSLSKVKMYDFWCGFINPKFIFQIRTDSFIKILLHMLKKSFTLLIMKLNEHYQFIKKNRYVEI